MALSLALFAAGAAHAQTSTPGAPAGAESTQADPAAVEQRAAESRLMKTLFGAAPPTSRSRACFTRVYDAAHLKAHPYQHVVEIRISAHYDPVERMRADSGTPRQKWGYAIHSRLRSGQVKIFKDEGECFFRGPDDNSARFLILCNPACDSGDHFLIDADGKSAKLSQKDDLVHPELTEPGSTAAQAAKADDGVFRLYRAKDSLCDFDKP